MTTSDPAAANFGATIPPRAEKCERAHEVIQIMQALWGSWEKGARLLDVDGKRFADMDKIQPVTLQGKHAASRGPLPIPPSEQGQPVIFQAGGGSYGLEFAGRYASGVYATPYTAERLGGTAGSESSSCHVEEPRFPCRATCHSTC